MVITIKKEIPNDQIVDMLITAIEGGSNYWCIVPTYDPLKWAEKIKKRLLWVSVYDRETAMQKAGPDEDDLLGAINVHSIRKGIRLMMEDYPEAFDRWMTGQYDAEDADIFLQLVTMGEVVFA